MIPHRECSIMTDSDLLADRYRPRRLADFNNNQAVINKLKGLINCQEIPHIIIQGGPGSGKKTLVSAYLREKFGDGVDRLQKHQVSLDHTNKPIELNVIQSPYHFQINPSLHGVYDRLIIQDFLKNLVRYRTINSAHCQYRTIVIDQADLLTHEAQQSLRRTLETYVGSFRCIFVCQQLGNLIPALQSRCLILRVASPSQLDIQTLIQTICQKENLALPEQHLNVLMKHNQGDYTRVLCDLEVIMYEYQSTSDQIIKLKYADISSIYQTSEEIVRLIYKSNDLMVVEKIRDLFYELLIHNSDPTEILKTVFYLCLKIIPNDQTQIQKQIIETSAQHQDLLIKGSKPIFHLESYAISLLVIIKNWLLKTAKTKTKNSNPVTQTSNKPIAQTPGTPSKPSKPSKPVAKKPNIPDSIESSTEFSEAHSVSPSLPSSLPSSLPPSLPSPPPQIIPKKSFPVSLHQIQTTKAAIPKPKLKIV